MPRQEDRDQSPYSIREAAEPDGPRVIEVLNYYIENSMAAYPEWPVNAEFFALMRAGAGGYPFYVLECGDQVVGFGYMRPYHPASTFRRTALRKWNTPYNTAAAEGPLIRVQEWPRQAGAARPEPTLKASAEGSGGHETVRLPAWSTKASSALTRSTSPGRWPSIPASPFRSSAHAFPRILSAVAFPHCSWVNAPWSRGCRCMGR